MKSHTEKHIKLEPIKKMLVNCKTRKKNLEVLFLKFYFQLVIYHKNASVPERKSLSPISVAAVPSSSVMSAPIAAIASIAAIT